MGNGQRGWSGAWGRDLTLGRGLSLWSTHPRWPLQPGEDALGREDEELVSDANPASKKPRCSPWKANAGARGGELSQGSEPLAWQSDRYLLSDRKEQGHWAHWWLAVSWCQKSCPWISVEEKTGE